MLQDVELQALDVLQNDKDAILLPDMLHQLRERFVAVTACDNVQRILLGEDLLQVEEVVDDFLYVLRAEGLAEKVVDVYLAFSLVGGGGGGGGGSTLLDQHIKLLVLKHRVDFVDASVLVVFDLVALGIEELKYYLAGFVQRRNQIAGVGAGGGGGGGHVCGGRGSGSGSGSGRHSAVVVVGTFE